MRKFPIVIACLLACGKGESKQTETTALEMGSAALQRFDPVRAIDVYLDGFHAMKDKPDMTMEAHHFCSAKSEDVMQCVIFDGNAKDANITGVEYIISEKLFDGLAADEKPLWHPHNFEILSGELVAPGLPSAAEKAFLKKKVNSYGKTWHFWEHGQPLPLGKPMLAWSFNADGEIPSKLLEDRDARLHVSTAQKRADRTDLASQARPQMGVDDLAGAFPGRKKPNFVKPL